MTSLEIRPSARGRSREGAWIEIKLSCETVACVRVAPARERGLKYYNGFICRAPMSRSREGAWIEIFAVKLPSSTSTSLPRGSVD